MDGWVDGWVGGWMGGWVDGWVDGWVSGSVDGWMGEWMDGWVCGQRGEKEGGKLVHKVLPAKTMITVVLMAVTTTGRWQR